MNASALCTLVPGAPDVSITQTEDAFTELSWKLKCKNGIMKKYHVTYYREDDTSDKETMTTNAEETKVRIENLAPGKTFVFEVSYAFVMVSVFLFSFLLMCLLSMFLWQTCKHVATDKKLVCKIRKMYCLIRSEVKS